jgi:hypothetical protein
MEGVGAPSVAAGGYDGAQADPDEVGGANKLQGREQLRAGEHDRRHAEAAGRYMDHAAETGAEARGDAFAPAAGQRTRGHIKQAGPGRDGEYEGGRDVESELGRFEHAPLYRLARWAHRPAIR